MRPPLAPLILLLALGATSGDAQSLPLLRFTGWSSVFTGDNTSIFADPKTAIYRKVDSTAALWIGVTFAKPVQVPGATAPVLELMQHVTIRCPNEESSQGVSLALDADGHVVGSSPEPDKPQFSTPAVGSLAEIVVKWTCNDGWNGQPSQVATHSPARVGAFSDSVVHLAGGDSVEWQSYGPAHVTGQQDGLLVTFHPFVAISDTNRVRQIALTFFDSLRVKFTNGGPAFVVLRAIDLRAVERTTDRRFRAFGVVLEKRADGHWYALHESSPVRP